MKKNKYIMIFLSVILAVATLIMPISKINADELESKFYNYDNYSTFVATYGEQLEQVRTYLEELGTYNYYIVVLPKSNVFFAKLYTSQNILSYLTLDESASTLKFNHQSINMNTIYVEFGSGYNFETQFNTLKTRIADKDYVVEKYGSSYSTSYDTNGIRTTFEFMYATNFNYSLSSDSVYSLNVNGTIVAPGDHIPTYYEYISGNEFDKNYSSAEYSKVEFDFDISTGNSLGSDFYLKLDVNAIIGDNQSGFSFSSPYIEYVYNLVSIDENGNISTSVKDYKDIVYISDMTDYNYSYENTKTGINGELENNGKYYIAVKLVVPFDSVMSQDIRVQLDSNLSYSLTEYTNEDYNYNLTSLDLTNKKGAILVTKDIENTFSANFEVNGYFYLEFRDSLSDTDYNVEKTYTYGFCDLLLENKDNYMCSTSNKFSYYFGFDNPYRVLHFRNLHSSEVTESSIYYDSSKFDVYIITNDDEFIAIKDPVTGEDVIFDISIFENNSQSEVTVEYLVGLIEDFLNTNENSWDLVKRVLELFFDYMPEEIYQAFVTILFVIFIGVIVMIVGWK